jgi:hypothetical protein
LLVELLGSSETRFIPFSSNGLDRDRSVRVVTGASFGQNVLRHNDVLLGTRHTFDLSTGTLRRLDCELEGPIAFDGTYAVDGTTVIHLTRNWTTTVPSSYQFVLVRDGLGYALLLRDGALVLSAILLAQESSWTESPICSLRWTADRFLVQRGPGAFATAVAEHGNIFSAYWTSDGIVAWDGATWSRYPWPALGVPRR